MNVAPGAPCESKNQRARDFNKGRREYGPEARREDAASGFIFSLFLFSFGGTVPVPSKAERLWHAVTLWTQSLPKVFLYVEHRLGVAPEIYTSRQS